LNFINQLLVYADDVNLVVILYILYGKSQKLQRSLVKRLAKSKSDRKKCVYMFCEQNAGQNHTVKIGNKYCKNAVKYLLVPQ